MQFMRRLLVRMIPRFSIRQLILLVAVCGVICATAGVWFQRVEKQKSIVKQLTDLGAGVTYEQRYLDRHSPNVVVTASTWRERLDDWLVAKFGTDAVYDVQGVYVPRKNAVEIAKLLPGLRSLEQLEVFLTEEQFDEAWKSLILCRQLKRLVLKPARTKRLRGISQLKRLENLQIDFGELDRDDFKEIAELDQLRTLKLDIVWTSDDALEALGNLAGLKEFHLTHAGLSEEVSSQGTAFLKSMPGLRRLTLARMPLIDDEVFALIGNLKQLEYLNLDQAGLDGSMLDQLVTLEKLTELNLIGTNVGDQAMQHIGKLKNLESLDLGSTQVSDAGMERLVELPNLKGLHLSGLKLTDKAMLHVSALKQLDELFMVRVPVTDAGIEQLLQMGSLRMIGLEQTRVTQKGLARIKQMLPKCRVW